MSGHLQDPQLWQSARGLPERDARHVRAGQHHGHHPQGRPGPRRRVLDFYLYWYSQAGAQLCYEETLANGNYVQGPCMIKGVTLSDELNEKLEGFVTSGPVKQYSSEVIGMSQATQADMRFTTTCRTASSAGRSTWTPSWRNSTHHAQLHRLADGGQRL